jgi:hypothetical protein
MKEELNKSMENLRNPGNKKSLKSNKNYNIRAFQQSKTSGRENLRA